MRVVADSHSLLFYLLTPAQLSDRALDALREAEDGDGVVVSAAEVVAIEPAMMDDFERVPLAQLGDPFDRFILATAAHLALPLVSRDRAITAAGIGGAVSATVLVIHFCDSWGSSPVLG